MSIKQKVSRKLSAILSNDVNGWGLLFILLSCLTACAPHPATHLQPTIAKDPVTAFKLQVDRLREELDIPGMSLLVLHRQQILFAEGFGYANLEKKISATPETPTILRR